MNREVRLDNQIVDVDETNIPAVIFNNPIFFDLSSIKANRTTTYRIPLTANNTRLLKSLGKVNAASDFARDFHELTEARDGLTVIPNARARVVGTTPKNVEFSVTWGALKTIADELEGISITDFPRVYIEWNSNSTFVVDDPDKSIGFLYFRTIQNLPDGDSRLKNMRYHYPSVRLDYLFDLIMSVVKSPVSFPADIKEQIRRFWIPVTKAQPDELAIYNPDSATTVKMYKERGDSLPWYEGASIRPPQVRMERNYANAWVQTSGSLGYLALPQGSYRARFEVNWTDRNAAGRNLLVILQWYNNDVSERRIHRVRIGSGGAVRNDEATIDFDITAPEWGGRNNNKSKLFVQFWYDQAPEYVSAIDYDTTRGTPPIVDVTVNIWKSQNQLTFGSLFPILANLPEINGLDLVKNIMFLLGLYARVNSNGVTEFNYIDDLLIGFENAFELEPYILDVEPDSLKYTYGDYARRNEYKYTEDELQSNDGDGAIIINDRTLAETKEIVKLMFAASDDDGSALVPLWVRTVNDEGTETLTFQGDRLKPRLLTAYTPDNTTDFTGTFSDSIKFSSILDDRYKLMQNILRDPKIIDIKIDMSTAMLYGFNDTQIFFFWGSYWLQIQTTANGDGTGDAQFIEIKRY